MKQISFAIIFAALALYLQSQAIVWIGYFALQEAIATHCENKSNPDCNGKCQVQKIEERTSNRTLVQVSIPDLSEFLIKRMHTLGLAIAQSRSFYTTYDCSLAQGHARQIFRPPISA